MRKGPHFLEVKSHTEKKATEMGGGAHSGHIDSKNFRSTIDAPPGVPWVSKYHIYFFKNETVFLLR